MDIDDTIMDWEEEYDKSFYSAFQKFGLKCSEETKAKIIELISPEYEKNHDYFTKELMIKFINEKTNLNLPIEFIDGILRELWDTVPKKMNEDIYNSIVELSKKYEMVVLTNWFEEEQRVRLEKVGLYGKYITKVFAPEFFKMKPHKESFIAACENHMPSECVMIGDNLETDVKGAINAGLHAIHYNKKGSYKKTKGYITINNFTQIEKAISELV
jgi:FMN phosphatase YigB (HAD superfamily)